MGNIVFAGLSVWNGSTATLIIDIILTVLVLSGIIIFCFKGKMNWKVYVTLAVEVVLIVLGIVLSMPLTIGISIISIAFLIFYSSILLTKPEKEMYFRAHNHVSNKDNKMTVNETDELIKRLTTAIKNLSESKTGALITIEKKDDMSQFIKTSGVSINAEVSPELLQTIFFDKTPLHDGATIIRRNMILWSAVFYQPSQKPLIGKYGSRHRAAIGISEVCDALTIVVSEETGKVSFAYKGELLPVPVAQLVDMLKEYINK